MNTSNKIIRGTIVLLFLSVVAYGYIQSMRTKKDMPIATIAIDPVTVHDHIRGNKNANVTIIEYSDFECPECIYFQPTIKKITQTYGNSIRWIVRPYPLPQHGNAESEAEAAECIYALKGNDAYWKFSDTLFANVHITVDGTGLPIEKLPIFAKDVGVDQNTFEHCFKSGEFATVIHNTMANAQTAGIQQLPSTIVIDNRGNMQNIAGNQPYIVYKSIIDQALTN